MFVFSLPVFYIAPPPPPSPPACRTTYIIQQLLYMRIPIAARVRERYTVPINREINQCI